MEGDLAGDGTQHPNKAPLSSASRLSDTRRPISWLSSMRSLTRVLTNPAERP